MGSHFTFSLGQAKSNTLIALGKGLCHYLTDIFVEPIYRMEKIYDNWIKRLEFRLM